MTKPKPDQIQKAAAALKRLHPFCAEIIDYHARIFEAQEEAAASLGIEAPFLSKEEIARKAREKRPLISLPEFTIDTGSAAALLATVCKIARETKGELALPAGAVLNAMDEGRLDPERLFAGLLRGDTPLLNDAAARLGAKPQILSSFVYAAMAPSLTVCAEQLSPYLKSDAPWEKGICPVCGSQPELSLLLKEGERVLFCSFCRHRWVSPRVFCPFCENRDAKSLRYFFVEEEKEYRVYLCDRCRRYLKTIDTRQTDRFVYPPLEQIATLHLDMKARAEGYESGAQYS